MKALLILVVASLWLGAAFPSPAQSTNKAVTATNPKPSSSTATNSSAQQVSDANKKDKAEFNNLQRELADLKAKAQKETGEARTALEKVIAELQKELDNWKPTVDDLHTATTNAWSDIKTTFDQGIKGIQKNLP